MNVLINVQVNNLVKIFTVLINVQEIMLIQQIMKQIYVIMFVHSIHLYNKKNSINNVLNPVLEKQVININIIIQNKEYNVLNHVEVIIQNILNKILVLVNVLENMLNLNLYQKVKNVVILVHIMLIMNINIVQMNVQKNNNIQYWIL